MSLDPLGAPSVGPPSKMADGDQPGEPQYERNSHQSWKERYLNYPEPLYLLPSLLKKCSPRRKSPSPTPILGI